MTTASKVLRKLLFLDPDRAERNENAEKMVLSDLHNARTANNYAKQMMEDNSQSLKRLLEETLTRVSQK